MSARQKLTLRPPCAECPFLKKALPGWLGDDTPQQVWAKVHGDNPFGYPCHMDVDKVKIVADGNDWDHDTWREDPGSVEQCTGALLHASKTGKMYEDPWREAARQAMGAMSRRINLTGILGIEFMTHHKERVK